MRAALLTLPLLCLSGCGFLQALFGQSGANPGTPTPPPAPVTDTAAPAPEPTDTAASPPPTGTSQVIRDCDLGGGYAIDTYLGPAPAPGEPAVWVGAVYQTRSDHSGGYHPMGQATVQFDLPGRNVLVLSSYEPVTWELSLGAGASLERVVVYGYHRQVVNGAGNVPVTLRTDPPCGYSWPYNGGGCDTALLWDAIEAEVGAPITRHDGCYDATDLRWEAPAP